MSKSFDEVYQIALDAARGISTVNPERPRVVVLHKRSKQITDLEGNKLTPLAFHTAQQIRYVDD
jgi:hypothetical protein